MCSYAQVFNWNFITWIFQYFACISPKLLISSSIHTHQCTKVDMFMIVLCLVNSLLIIINLCHNCFEIIPQHNYILAFLRTTPLTHRPHKSFSSHSCRHFTQGDTWPDWLDDETEFSLHFHNLSWAGHNSSIACWDVNLY